MGSSRLPGKMSMLFYNELTLLDVVLKKMQELSGSYPVIVATSVHPNDDVIEACANKYNLIPFRGDESDVLNRFIAAAEKNGVDTVVRVCADNPFLSTKLITELIAAYNDKEFDYISYQNSEGTPTIRTHYGFFAEIVKLSALKNVAESTQDKFYHEHVTNFIYANRDLFKIKLLEIPFKENTSVRLTIDTKEDFTMAREIYADLMTTQHNVEPDAVMDYLNLHPDYLELMNQQIQLQTK